MLSSLMISFSTLVTIVTGSYLTSSLKIENFARQEEVVLAGLKRYIDLQLDNLKIVTSFYTDRLKQLNLQQTSRRPAEDYQHPNVVYRTIKRFSSDFAHILGDNFAQFQRHLESARLPFATDRDDKRGANLSILRLQAVYKLRAIDVAAGNYLGFKGPPLSVQDTFEIGQLAFSESMWNQSVDWFKVTVARMSRLSKEGDQSGPTLGKVKAQIGRAYLYSGDISTAQAFYDIVKYSDPEAKDTLKLREELKYQIFPKERPEKKLFHNYSRLCRLGNDRHHIPNRAHPSGICRYKQALLSWNVYREEILSVKPFVSVIYNVTTDREVAVLKDYVQFSLARGLVEADDVSDLNSEVSDIRTSDLAWIWDDDIPEAEALSKRIGQITGLEVSQTMPAYSAEAFQIVNYGLGGHYEPHVDPLDFDSSMAQLRFSGNRIATFLVYLSDVTRGGSTVFTKAGIAVSPVKHMALFWYNYSPAYELDEMTEHAGCPVLIGHKWRLTLTLPALADSTGDPSLDSRDKTMSVAASPLPTSGFGQLEIFSDDAVVK